MPAIQKLFQPLLLAQVDSATNGQLKVLSIFGEKYIATGFWTQSGGLVKELWQDTLKHVKPARHASWLVLGLGGGTVAQIISQKYQPSQIVGVEIDPAMIDLGKHYLSLSQISNLDIVCQDAGKYLKDTTSHFDYLLVDLYVADKSPQFVYSPKFISLLKKVGGTVIINHLFYTELHKSNSQKLITVLEKHFSSVQLFRKLTNLMIISS